MDTKNLLYIGTSHIAKESLTEITKAFNSFHPDIVAVELDRKRLHGLFSKEEQKITLSDIRRIGVKGFLFAYFGRYAQKKLGGMVGVAPGSEMKLAVTLAKQNKLQVALIDQDIDITLKRFSKALTWREKFRFIGDILKSIFRKKAAMRDLGIENLDLSKIPSDKLVKNLIKQLKVRYPSIHKVLVEERNYVMSKNLLHLMKKFPDKKIMIIIGAGHEEEMVALTKKAALKIDIAP